MKSDKLILKELVEYFDDVMEDVANGNSFEERNVPDYRGHELEFRIDMVIDLLHEMMCTYSTMRDFIFRTNGTGNDVCWPNVNDFLEKYEKRMSDNNKKIE